MKPEPVTKETLLQVLADITRLVEANDSLEGTLEYSSPGPGDPETTLDGYHTEFMLQASYRFGNSQGQGSIQLVGLFERP